MTFYSSKQYYADPDGVVWRGMGGWTDTRTNFISPPTLAAFDSDSLRSQGCQCVSPTKLDQTIGFIKRLFI